MSGKALDFILDGVLEAVALLGKQPFGDVAGDVVLGEIYTHRAYQNSVTEP